MEVGTVLSVVRTVLSVLRSEELKQALSIFHYKTQLSYLKGTVESINAVLREAEFKKLSPQDQIFIDKLKDAAFEVDDLLDEFLTLAAHKQLLKDHGNITQKFSNFLSNPKNALTMSSRVKDIKKKLDYIAYNRKFNFKIDPEPIKKRSRETDSYINKDGIIGRDDDLKKIVSMLLASNDPKSSNVSVLSVVGIGGLGKTALAQLVYNDPGIGKAFPLKMWTCVSDQDQEVLDVKDILCKILASITHKKPDKDLMLDEVQSQLRTQLADNRYLLVLDDVWTENSHQWRELMKYLVGNKMGSWILVTTRSQNTATITSGLIHELSGLSKENSWSLFKRMAFDLEKPNPLDEELVSIGEKIVDECAGVPLAIRVAGTLLYGQDKSKWLSVQQVGLTNFKDARNDIVPILELSFHHLESPLKNCFRYCAIFPKDYEMEKEVLISLWMAQGYIGELDEGQTIENAAEDYFSILLKRCFFQDIKKNKHGEIKSCKMHDLMHDVAQKVSRGEIYTLNNIGGNVDEKVRHLSVFNMSKFAEYYSSGNTHIRSLFLFINPHELHCQLALDTLVKKIKCLRVLDLSGEDFKSVPGFIDELLHLRYIDLSWNVEIEALPKSITKLCNLQTMILRGCKNLKELPKDLCRLVKLRVLNVKFCDELRWMMDMGKGKGEMTCLHTLKGEYIVGGKGRWKTRKQWLNGLEFLKTLIKLEGKLNIHMWWPKNAKGDFMEDNLREESYLRSLEHLDRLKIVCDYEEDIHEGAEEESDEEESDDEEDEGIRMRVMEDLKPHPNLKRLKVCRYDGVEMPSWLTRLPNLVNLHLKSCEELKYLPCLGELRHLEFLHLENCRKLKYLPWLGNLCRLKVLKLEQLPKLEYIIVEEDTTGLASTRAEKVSFYPSLEKLELSYLPKLKGWSRNNSIMNPQVSHLSLSQLKKMRIEDCAMLTCTLLCPMLEILGLHGFNEEMRVDCTKTTEKSRGVATENPGSTHHVPKLRELTVSNGAWLDLIPRKSFQSLQTVGIEADCVMEELPNNLQFSSALQTLQISDCDNLKAVPNWMQELTSLKHLKINCTPESLKERCREDPPGEDWLLIQHIPNIDIC